MRAAVRLGCLAALLAGAAALGVAACHGGSAAPPAGGDEDGGDSGGSADATREDGGLLDAGHDSALKGNCEPVKGRCDLVLQDCEAGTQCAAEEGADGGYTATCVPTYPVQHIGLGYPCCPPAQADQDTCLPGLVCVGDPCVGDAGGGRCSPYCCAGDDTPCGQSPEGFAGHCDVGVVDNAGTPLYDVCEYAAPCEPLGIVPCPAGYACLVEDTTGSAKCSEIFNGGAAPAAEGQACAYDNSCAAGLMCLTTSSPEGGSISECLMLCSTGTGTPPFDAGALGMGPGTGGCDTGKQCVSAPQIFPAWLGVCIDG